MIRNRNTNMPPRESLKGLALIEADWLALEAQRKQFKRPRTGKIMCTRGTAKLRYGHRGARNAGGRYS